MLNCGWKSEATYHQEENKQIIHVKIRIIVTKLSRTHSLRYLIFRFKFGNM